MEKIVSVCGCICSDCVDFGKECPGCEKLKGRVSWAPYLGLEVCPLYDCCVNRRGLTSCGDCPKLPCSLFYDTRDPSTTKEQHEADIRERVDVLRNQCGSLT
ncbi:DUF3795 domain-containing protein [Zongyangia hominis]|uniref:DUF3795 domain-containing protein n=1 Tax=Zongyangia hominis TaxID=2763677 RepID=A0A926EBF3_9FIRM|nr:DUF3795 domain-containing protein [Zongyangia hominis]MBC8570802.1 DUF3795 domain-containing protein [Zongyangia hominis]